MKTINGFKDAKKIVDRSIHLDDSLDTSVSGQGGGQSIQDSVNAIIKDVRANGDDALISYNMKFDLVKTEKLEVTRKEIDNAYREINARLLSDLKLIHCLYYPEYQTLKLLLYV